MVENEQASMDIWSEYKNEQATESQRPATSMDLPVGVEQLIMNMDQKLQEMQNQLNQIQGGPKQEMFGNEEMLEILGQEFLNFEDNRIKPMMETVS